MSSFRLLRPQPDRKIVYGVVGNSVHLFLYPWGATIRVRRGENWRHGTVKASMTRFTQGTARARCTIEAETWKTAAGTTIRVPFSKRYIKLKVLI